jgi:hypothetical protein
VTFAPLAVVEGDAVWLVIAAVSVLALGAAVRWRQLTNPWDGLRWFLQSWAGRAVALGAWSVAGWHLFCQRP